MLQLPELKASKGYCMEGGGYTYVLPVLQVPANKADRTKWGLTTRPLWPDPWGSATTWESKIHDFYAEILDPLAENPQAQQGPFKSVLLIGAYHW